MPGDFKSGVITDLPPAKPADGGNPPPFQLGPEAFGDLFKPQKQKEPPFAEPPQEGAPNIPVLKPGLEMALPTVPQPKVGPTGVKIFEQASPAIVEIETNKGMGSGYFADKDGHIVTDAHVVLGAREIVAVTADGTRYKAEIDKLDDLNDLASLKLKNLNKPMPYLEHGSSATLTADQPIYALGHPLGIQETYLSPGYMRQRTTYANMLSEQGDEIMLAVAGRMTHLTPEETPDAVTTLSRPLLEGCINIKHGNSGGPLLDKTGKVVGVSDMVDLNDTTTGYFTPSEKVADMLAKDSKFKFAYRDAPESWAESYEYQWMHKPVAAVAETSVAGLLGYGGYRAMNWAPKLAGVGLGLYGATRLLSDADSFVNSADSADSWKYGLASLADVSVVAGSVAMLVPRARTIGMLAVGTGLVGHMGTSFIPNHHVLTDITRTDGTLRPPMTFP